MNMAPPKCGNTINKYEKKEIKERNLGKLFYECNNMLAKKRSGSQEWLETPASPHILY
jgi:hypothetical protein